MTNDLCNKFITVITKSGKQISGQVKSINNTHLTVKPLVLKYHPDKRMQQKLNLHLIAIDNITSLTQLDASDPPKLAQDWPDKQYINTIVEIETNEN